MLKIIEPLMSPIIPGPIKYIFIVLVGLTLIYWAFLMVKLKAPVWMVYFLPAWAVIATILSRSERLVVLDQIQPQFIFLPTVPIGLILFFVLRGRLDAGLMKLPRAYLVLPQASRIVVEWVLFSLFMAGVVPRQMTFEGYNFDIVTGILGLLLGLTLCFRLSKIENRILSGFNIIGSVLLFTIVVIAVLSAPLPIRQFWNEPSNSMIAFFPMILLPTIIVVFAAALHGLSLRQVWLLEKNAKSILL